MPWPDFMKLPTLAERLDQKAAYVEQLVKRGLLPPPHMLGESPVWCWDEVDAAIRARKTVERTADDPYEAGASRASQAAAPATRQDGAQPRRHPVLLPAAPPRD